MGNQSSSAPSSSNNQIGTKSEKLLRRNKRTAFQKPPSSPVGSSFGTFPVPNEQRTNRSRSLEPQCAETVKIIEHSQSARYPKSRRKNPNFLSPNLATNSPTDDIGNEDVSICITGLTQHQKMIIQKVWMRAGPQEIIECAKSIVAHLLRTNPTLLPLFHLSHVNDAELQLLPHFSKLSANFAMVFDFVMTNLVDDLTNVCAALESLGEHHKELGLTIEMPMWTIFQRVFEDNPPKSVHQNADGHAAWKLMVAFIVRQTHFGYEKARQKSENQSFDSNSD